MVLEDEEGESEGAPFKEPEIKPGDEEDDECN